jgi:hypothetical protein
LVLLGDFVPGVLILGVTGSLYADLGVPAPNKFFGRLPEGGRKPLPLGIVAGLGTNLGGGTFGEASEGGISLGSCAEAFVAVATVNKTPTKDRVTRKNDIETPVRLE